MFWFNQVLNQICVCVSLSLSEPVRSSRYQSSQFGLGLGYPRTTPHDPHACRAHGATVCSMPLKPFGDTLWYERLFSSSAPATSHTLPATFAGITQGDCEDLWSAQLCQQMPAVIQQLFTRKKQEWQLCTVLHPQANLPLPIVFLLTWRLEIRRASITGGRPMLNC